MNNWKKNSIAAVVGLGLVVYLVSGGQGPNPPEAKTETKTAIKPETKKAPELVVTREEYGARWPWPKFDRGVIRCHDDQVTITMGTGPVIYGLNGRSQSRGRYPDSRTVMEREPGTSDLSADGLGLVRLGASSELIQRGLALCQGHR